MKRKWNWLDTVIVVLIVAIIVGAVFFFLRPQQAILQSAEKNDFTLTVDTPRDKAGTYDALQVGDEVYMVGSNDVFGIIEKVEILPFKATSFNEQTKQLQVYNNTDFPFCRVFIKTNGYMTDDGTVYAQGSQIIVDKDINLESKNFRFGGKVSGVKGVGSR